MRKDLRKLTPSPPLPRRRERGQTVNVATSVINPESA